MGVSTIYVDLASRAPRKLFLSIVMACHQYLGSSYACCSKCNGKRQVQYASFKRRNNLNVNYGECDLYLSWFNSQLEPASLHELTWQCCQATAGAVHALACICSSFRLSLLRSSGVQQRAAAAAAW
eukprot:985214-Pelagomonas_calceolata.AAC.1